jgi:transposase
MAVCQERFANRWQNPLTALPAAWPSAPARPIRIFCEDESRFGLSPIQRRRITLTGVKPVGTIQYRFETFYVHGAVEPTTAESFFLELPQMNTVNFPILLKELAQQYQHTLNIILMEDNSCHKALSLGRPQNIVQLFLPAYSRDLNPMERVWQDLKDRLAWVLVAQLEELEHHVATCLRQDVKAALHSLTDYPYFMRAVNALSS